MIERIHKFKVQKVRTAVRAGGANLLSVMRMTILYEVLVMPFVSVASARDY
jgi:hypothetical protein